MTIPVILDAVVIFLLMGTITYTFVLNKKLSILRQDRQALEGLLQGLVSLTDKTEKSIKSLKKAAQESLDQVDERFENSQAMRDELTFLVERGERVCDQLTEYIDSARKYKAPTKQDNTQKNESVPKPKTAAPKSRGDASIETDMGDYVDFEEAKQKKTPKEKANENSLLRTLRKIR